MDTKADGVLGGIRLRLRRLEKQALYEEGFRSVEAHAMACSCSQTNGGL